VTRLTGIKPENCGERCRENIQNQKEYFSERGTFPKFVNNLNISPNPALPPAIIRLCIYSIYETVQTDAVFAVGMQSKSSSTDAASAERRAVAVMRTAQLLPAPVASGYKTRRTSFTVYYITFFNLPRPATATATTTTTTTATA